MTKKELNQLYKSVLKDEMKKEKKTQKVSKILQDKANGVFSDEKEFLDKIIKMSNTEILKEYDSIISEYLNIQSVLGDISNCIYPSLLNFQYYNKCRHEDATVFAENLKNDIQFQYLERFSRYKSEYKEKIINFLLDQKNFLDNLFSPPCNHQEEYINLINELIKNQREQQDDNSDLEKINNQSKNVDDEVMFGGVIPLSVMKEFCFDKIQLGESLSADFFAKISRLLKAIAKKPKDFEEKLKYEPTFSSIMQDAQQHKVRGSSEKKLQYIFNIAKSDPAIKELAEKLGRSGGNNSKIKRKIKVSQDSWTEASAYKGQITGLKLSDNISSVINSELALYKSPATKKLFMKKYSQKQLLSYSYKLKHRKAIIAEKEKKEVPPSSKGPVLVCVDTSASMYDSLDIVKALALCLAEVVEKENRRCYFLTFDCGYRIYDIGYGCKKSPHKKLRHFLMEQAGGGTDPSECLEMVLSLLSQKNWKDADVLTISDFEMDNLHPDLKEEIKIQQSKKTKFYGLLIEGKHKANIDILSSFDENYFYTKGDTKLEKLEF